MLQQKILLFQGAYYVLSGIWPLAHIDSFVRITGPKQDLWLVYMVGLLSLVIGTTLFIHSFDKKGKLTVALSILGIGTAVSFTLIDVKYSVQDVIWNTYLIDAGIQIVLMVLWILVLSKRSKEAKNHTSG